MPSYGTENFEDNICKHCSSLGYHEYYDRDSNVNWITYTCKRCSKIKYIQYVTDGVYRQKILNSIEAHAKVYLR